MNVKRFTARTSRDALSLVRQALGDDAVVLSTKPSAGGVEVLAMAPEGMRQVERMSAEVPSAPQAESAADAAPSGFLKRASADVRIEPQLEDTPVEAIRRIRPDIWVKGGDYTAADLPEAAVIAEWGGRAVTVPFHPGRSTTRLAAALAAVG